MKAVAASVTLSLVYNVPQQLKKSKQTEEDMLYGTSVRTPAKRRLLGTPTANKTRRVSPPSSYNGINASPGF